LEKDLIEVEAEEEVVVHSEDEEEVEEIFDPQVVVSEVLEVEDVVVVVEIISPAEERETMMNQNGEMTNMKRDFMDLHEIEPKKEEGVNLKILQQKVDYRLA
jgi:signal recognition particle GTPase